MAKKKSRKNKSKSGAPQKKSNLKKQVKTNKKNQKPLQPKKSTKQKASKQKASKQNSSPKAIQPINTSPPKVETTFSKKLEEEISKNQTALQKIRGLFPRSNFLLQAPKIDWKKLYHKFVQSFLEIGKKLGIAFLIIFLLTSITITLELISSERVMPRVAMANMDLGYLKIGEAKEEISLALNNFTQTPFTFYFEEEVIQIPLEELRIQILNDETLEQLPYFEFMDDTFAHLIISGISAQQLNPIYVYDLEHVSELLEQKFSLAERRAKDAAFYLDEEGSIQIRTEEAGQRIDQTELQHTIQNRIENLDSSTIQLSLIAESPQITSAELQQYSEDLLLKIENEIVIKYQDQSWPVKLIDHIDAVAFEKRPDHVNIKITPQFLQGYLQENIFTQIEKPKSDIKIYYNQEEQVVFEGEATDGLTIDKNSFLADYERAINTYEGEVTIQTVVNKAIVEVDEKLQELGVKELVGTGHTAFAGSSANRRHNIDVAMAKFNGLLIAPGETFSFNDNLGEVDGQNGYKLELVIKSTGTIPEYGGGVCQVSSTAFKAALMSGLPIVERYPHSYAVSYYAQIDGYGLDATIYPGVKDLKFSNDTPNHILMQAYTKGDEAFFKFYGTGDGRQVKIENYKRWNYRSSGATQLIPTSTLAPGVRKQVETAHTGFDASWDRIITNAEGEEQTETIVSNYRATTNKILVGEA